MREGKPAVYQKRVDAPVKPRRRTSSLRRGFLVGTALTDSAHMGFMEKIPGLNFTAIDFEAANSDRLSVISAGYAAVRDGIVTATGTWLIYPETGLGSFDEYAMRIHGITPAMAAAGEPLEDSMERLFKIFGGDPVLAHNMKYERSVITKACQSLKLAMPKNEMRCSETLARTALPELTRTRLSAVAEALELPEFIKHDSGADALACARVVLAIAARSGATNIRGLYAGLGIQ